jgi:hypothetical protein
VPSKSSHRSSRCDRSRLDVGHFLGEMHVLLVELVAEPAGLAHADRQGWCAAAGRPHTVVHHLPRERVLPRRRSSDSELDSHGLVGLTATGSGTRFVPQKLVVLRLLTSEPKSLRCGPGGRARVSYSHVAGCRHRSACRAPRSADRARHGVIADCCCGTSRLRRGTCIKRQPTPASPRSRPGLPTRSTGSVWNSPVVSGNLTFVACISAFRGCLGSASGVSMSESPRCAGPLQPSILSPLRG